MTKKIVTVFTATGRQGGGAVEYLCEDGTFHVRAVTRKPDSDAAKALAAKGAEIVVADLNDKASLVKSMEGAYGVFGVTDFWTADGKEEIHGRNLVDAAKETGVKHFVWSTLNHSPLKVPHFETKANINDYLIASGVPRTSLYTSWFYENFGPFVNIKRGDDGVLHFDLGVPSDAPFVCISGKDCGVLAAVALKNPDKYIGKDILGATALLSPRQMVPILEEIVGEKIKLKDMSMEEFDKAKDTMWSELWLNYKWFYLHQEETRDVPATLAILPKVRSLKDCIIEKGGKDVILAK